MLLILGLCWVRVRVWFQRYLRVSVSATASVRVRITLRIRVG
jgi:hypothetical protein